MWGCREVPLTGRYGQVEKLPWSMRALGKVYEMARSGISLMKRILLVAQKHLEFGNSQVMAVH